MTVFAVIGDEIDKHIKCSSYGLEMQNINITADVDWYWFKPLRWWIEWLLLKRKHYFQSRVNFAMMGIEIRDAKWYKTNTTMSSDTIWDTRAWNFFILVSNETRSGCFSKWTYSIGTSFPDAFLKWRNACQFHRTSIRRNTPTISGKSHEL